MTTNKVVEDARKNNWIDIIINVVKAAQSVGIDNIIIEPESIRAIDDSKTVVLFQDKNVPTLSIGRLGMGRIHLFMNRYNIVMGGENPRFKAITDKHGQDVGYVTSIIMENDNTVVEYRCQNPDTIQAPKKINDTSKFRMSLPRKSAKLIKSAQGAMGSELITFTSDGNGVFYTILDINGDEFKHRFSDSAMNLNDSDSAAHFSHKYPVKVITAALAGNEEAYVFDIGEKGIITTEINRLNVLILPQV